MRICSWPLGDGTTLEFTVYDFNKTWNKDPRLYIFANFDGGRWNAVYIGQAADFSSRLPSHELRDQARRNGATHIHQGYPDVISQPTGPKYGREA